MFHSNFSTQLNVEEERRRALAKIYALLLKVAEDVQNASSPSETNAKDFETTIAPLQENIPPAV